MHTMPIRIFLVFTIITLLNQSLLHAAPEKRIALVIGNSNYSSSPLKNPSNDAKDMADALRNLGFHVILKANASKREMGKAIEDFGKQLKERDIGLFYYAGHGVQINGVNYLIPVGVTINEETDVEFEAVDAGRILATMHNAKSRVNIVILDACRDNPYARSFRSTTRGLAIIAKAPMGTIISYSTSPGDVALDGKGRNSPYTSSLLQYMKESGISIEQVFKNTRQKLTRETGGKQIPWELSSLQGDFFFIHGKPKAFDTTAESLPLQQQKSETLQGKTAEDELELAMARMQEKKDKEEQLFRELASDIKKYRSIKEADIDENLKERAWQVLIKKYPQWSTEVGSQKESGIINRVIKTDKSGFFKKILQEEGISFIQEIKQDGRFIAYENGTVLDTKTNLMWAAKDSGKMITWQNANSYCENYRGGGYADWRMPTQDELAGLYDSNKSYKELGADAYVHLTELISLTRCCHWASDSRGSDAAYFNFSNGQRYWFPRIPGNLTYALPVRVDK